MTSRRWRRLCLLGVSVAAILSTGCNELVRRSVRDGVFSYVTGGIRSSFSENGAINDLLNSLFTGSLFGGTGTTGS